MRIITLINEKGGVGKTTLAMHTAAGLAIRGASVLLIDADPQSNTTTNLRFHKTEGLFKVVAQDGEWSDNVRMVSPEIYAGDYPTDGRLALLPSGLNNRLIPMAVQNTNALLERIGEIETAFDFVIVDTSPMPSLLHEIIYRATDFVMIPTHFSLNSLEGLAASAQRTEKEQEYRNRNNLKPVTLLGIQPTRYEKRTNAHTWGLEKTKEYFGQHLFDPIPKAVAWEDAANAKSTVFAERPGTSAELAAWALIDRVQVGVYSCV